MQVLHQLPKFDDPNILVGGDAMDDAGVYKIDQNLAIVQSVDVLTPIADDPYIFGQIVAANALSDIYAMGAKPLTALCIISYPPDRVKTDVIVKILNGLGNKTKEAGAVIIGGHTLKDVEIKCGLAVTGIVRPDQIITNRNARYGDKLILTKPLGTGIVSTALKANLSPTQAVDKINFYMSQLNRDAAEAMVEFGVSSATDITGFGLLGHAWEMAEMSNVSMKIYHKEVPIIEEAFALAKMSLFPQGSIKNFEFVKPKVNFSERLSEEVRILLYDAQTSGGLLISIANRKASKLLNLLHKKGLSAAKIIGEVIEPKEKRIYVE